MLHCEGFYRLYKQGTLYYAGSYEHEKNETTLSAYIWKVAPFIFAQIVLFILHPKPCVIINKIITDDSSTQQAGYARNRRPDNHQKVDILNEFMKMKQAGYARRLDNHQKVDILNEFMKMKQSRSPIVIDFMNLVKKAVLIKTGSQQYIFALIKSYELY